MDLNRTILNRIVVLGTGIVLGVLAYSALNKEIVPKPKRRKKIRPIIESNSIESFDVSNWAVDESDNLLSLLISIAENEAISDTIIHRSVTCNHCGMSPLRGFRFKCANCVDFDVCSSCEALDVHFKTHTFIKIRIPIPPQANPRSLIFPAFYPGIPWTSSTSFDTFKLENETHCNKFTNFK
jgi:hypothetical protein